MSKLIAFATLAIALLAIYASYTQFSALNVSQSSQPRQRYYWGRRGMILSGRRYGDRWEPTPDRETYSTFRGGGIGSGK
ncbi:MAG: hypothetical protein AAFY15_13675 [Cyanobacteria bacterium J06648_11]